MELVCRLKKKCESLLSLNLVGQDASTDKQGYSLVTVMK